MKGLLFLMICGFYISNLASAQESNLKDSIKTFYDSGEFEALKTFIGKKLKTDSLNFDLLFHFAQSDVKLNDFQGAYKTLSKAIEIYPDSSILYNDRGYLLLSSRLFQDAFNDYNTVLRLAKNNMQKKIALLNIAAVQLSVREFQGALENLLAASTLDPADVGVLMNLSSVYSELGFKEDAIETLQKAIRIDPDFMPLKNNLGFIYLNSEDYEEALPLFDLILAQEPSDSFALNNRSYCKFKIGDTDGALEDVNSSIEIDSRNPYAYRNRALIKLKLNKMDEACDDLQLALNNDFTIMYGEEVNQLIEQNCK